jgi:hypothetical protein
VNESIRGSVPAVWHVSLEMDVDHVWDAFFIYSLLLDHAERDAVLRLDHSAPSQAKRIQPALLAGEGHCWRMAITSPVYFIFVYK